MPYASKSNPGIVRRRRVAIEFSIGIGRIGLAI